MKRAPARETKVDGAPYFALRDEDREAVEDLLAELLVTEVEREAGTGR